MLRQPVFYGIAAWMPQTAQTEQVPVYDARRLQDFETRFSIELGTCAANGG